MVRPQYTKSVLQHATAVHCNKARLHDSCPVKFWHDGHADVLSPAPPTAVHALHRFSGRIEEWDGVSKHLVMYDDGDEEWVNLATDKIKLLPDKGKACSGHNNWLLYHPSCPAASCCFTTLQHCKVHFEFFRGLIISCISLCQALHTKRRRGAGQWRDPSPNIL